MIPLSWYLLVAALLFCIGLYGVVARRSCAAPWGLLACVLGNPDATEVLALPGGQPCLPRTTWRVPVVFDGAQESYYVWLIFRFNRPVPVESWTRSDAWDRR